MKEPSRAPTTDYDGAWKAALKLYLEAFLRLCFPQVHAAIDWGRPIEFLDKELQEIVRDAQIGPLRVDLLVKVFRRDGVEEWLLIHIEIQSQPDPHLSRRVYRYRHRIADRYDRPVVTLVVLADPSPGFRPWTKCQVTSNEINGRGRECGHATGDLALSARSGGGPGGAGPRRAIESSGGSALAGAVSGGRRSGVGRRELVNAIFARYRERLGPQRRDGARPVRGLAGLSCRRALRLRVTGRGSSSAILDAHRILQPASRSVWLGWLEVVGLGPTRGGTARHGADSGQFASVRRFTQPPTHSSMKPSRPLAHLINDLALFGCARPSQ